MDIDLLAKMVGDLILDNDEVALPGVGTFVAEFMGASFSDKGFIINPPYRKLSFRQREGDPDLLIDLYARTNQLDKTTAAEILTRFLSEMKEVLKSKKYIIFPGLGRLRATKENLFFFVPDASLNIYPEGFGLEPVSLKTHEELTEITELEETVKAVAGLAGPAVVADSQSSDVVAPASELPVQPAMTPSPASDVPEQTPPTPDVQEMVAPADKTATSALQGVPPKDTPTAPKETPAPSQGTSAPQKNATALQDPHPEETSAPAHTASVHQSQYRRKASLKRPLLLILCIIVGALLLLAILGRVTPKFVDRFLYSPEELELLYK